MLILTGVLLVMGFVVVGSTLVKVQTLEESTARIERDSVLDVFDDVVLKFDQTLLSGAQIGDTNIDSYKDRSAHAADRMRNAAIGRGLFLTADLQPDPSNSVFWSDDKCGAFSSKASGIIVGYERTTRKETIVGAVYDLYATNGDQSIAATYYVKLYDCMLTRTTSYVHAYEAAVADSVTGFDGAKAEGDNAEATLVEEFVPGPLAPSTDHVLQSSIVKQLWMDQGSIQISDGFTADLDAAPRVGADWIEFKLDVSAHSDAAVWQNVVFKTDAWRKNGVYLNDRMMVQATHAGNTVGPYALPVTATNPSAPLLPSVAFPNAPGGLVLWTKTVMANTVWRIYIDEPTGQDLNVEWEIDYVEISAERGTAWHDLEVEFEFDTIPPIFDTHDVDIRYQVTGWWENFTFQVWDGAQWNTRTTLVAPALGTWTSATDNNALPYRLTAAEFNGGTPLFRILDVSSSDGAPTKQSTLKIDYLKITSEFIP